MEIAEYHRMAAAENTHWWYRGTRSLLRQLLLTEYIIPGATASHQFLDAGCGTGATGAWLSEFGSVVAMDAAPEALELYESRHPLAVVTLGDIQSIPLPDQAVDGPLGEQQKQTTE